MGKESSTVYEIRPVSKFTLGLKEVWVYRELLYFFAWRDIKVKYKQTVLGVLWLLFQPLILMIVFTTLLGSKFSGDLPVNVPYPLFILSGVLCWNIFSTAINNAGNGMISNAPIIKKIYFPRLIIPLSSVIVSFVDFCIGFLFYAAALIYFNPQISYASLLFVPVALALLFFAALGSGMLFSALSIKYRDFKYLLPFFVQALMFVSPVFYPLTRLAQEVKLLFALNPAYAPVELFRAHLYSYSIDTVPVLISVASNVSLLFAGIFIFRKTERYFADLA